MSTSNVVTPPRLGPDWAALASQIGQNIGPDAVSRRALDRHAMAHDASSYLLIPEMIVRPTSADQVAAVMGACAASSAPIVFRSGGTSLSGQAVSDAVMVDTRRHFQGVEVLEEGKKVRVLPGSTVRQVNARLAAYGRKLGPDPESEGACTLGGVIANNSSGMHCGTEFNTYSTLESMVVILPTGTRVDTGDPGASAYLRAVEPALWEGLTRLHRRVNDDAASVATITRLFSMKNTMGYGINSFVDYSDPIDLLAHLMVGSEGTLGFVAEAVFSTVPVAPHVTTGLLIFDDIATATAAVPALVATGTATAELLDAASLRVSATDPSCPAQIADLQVREHAAILIEYQAMVTEELRDLTETALPQLRTLPVQPFELTDKPSERAGLWRVRKGLYSAVAGARPRGTNALLEDVSVPVDLLGQTCVSLTELFTEHEYDGSVMFGHAKDGNVHFLLNERFEDEVSLRRYEAFTEDMVDLVLGNGGSLKAEHGTGRIMAPFVRRQYGDELYAVMHEVKNLIDPQGLLNPGTVLSDDPTSYMRDLKPNYEVEPEVDRCVECGYCEPVCPSRDLTLTPRQRIVLRREINAARSRGDESLAQELERDYTYAGEQTCAVDGMCLTACPVLINTGDLVRRLRSESANRPTQLAWTALAHGWGVASRAGGLGLSAAKILPSGLPVAATSIARRWVGPAAVPMYDGALPGGGTARPSLTSDSAQAVLFAACIGSMFGAEDGGAGAGGALVELCERAGVSLRTPAGLGGLCCGTPWKSKGLTQGYDVMAAKVVPALREATEGGRLPVVTEASSCVEGLVELLSDRAPEITVLDAVTFVAEAVLPSLSVRKLDSVVVHPTCSMERAGGTPALMRVARALSDEAVVPLDWGCCAFAGDRGLLHPELTASATRREADEVRGTQPSAYVSSNRTCEIGMTRATGQTYRHVLEVLAEATR